MKKRPWRRLVAPLIALAAVSLFVFLWNTLGLPTDTEIFTLVDGYYQAYGFWVIFISAILESLLFVGMYVPGSTAIFFGVILARGNVPQIGLVILIATVGLLVSHTVNYALGRYGWYHLLARFGLARSIEGAKARLERYGPTAIWITHWHPNMGALTSTAAGILSFPTHRFFLHTALAVLAWDTFWGTGAGLLGKAAFDLIGPFFAFIVVGAWFVISLVKAIAEGRKQAKAS